jgi:hypothetical protein
MQREQVRNLVAQQFNRSLAESGVQITAIPQPQLRAIVDALADSLFAVIDAIEEEGMDAATPIGTVSSVSSSAIGAASTRATPGESADSPTGSTSDETLLWRGRPYLTIGTRYELTNQRLRVFRGILGNQIEEVELIRVKDTRVKQHVGERLLNVGDISVLSADSTTPEIILHNVHDPLDVRELIRKTVMEEKTRRGIRYREDIGEENQA